MNDQEEINRLDDMISMLIEHNGRSSVRAERAEDTIERLQEELLEARGVIASLVSVLADWPDAWDCEEINRANAFVAKLQGETP